MDMRLNEKYFNLVKEGKKLCEVRLNDKKRKELSVGSVITFSNRANMNEKVKVEVTNLEYFSNFNGIFSKYEVEKVTGSSQNKEDIINELNSIYSAEEVSENGVVVIEFSII